MDRGTTFTAGIPGRHYTSAMGSKSESESHSVIFDSLRRHGLYSPWNSPGQNTGVGSLSLLQGIFPTQESNQGLLHGRRVLYHLSYEGSPMGSRLTSTGVTSWYNRLSIHLPSVVSLPQTHNPCLMMRRTSESIEGHSAKCLMNALLITVKVIKTKKNLRNCDSQEEPKET